MTTPDTAEKISTVGSAPSQEAVPPQTTGTLDDVYSVYLKVRSDHGSPSMRDAFFKEFGVKKLRELAPSQYRAAGEFFRKYLVNADTPPQTHHCGADAHDWSSDGDPGPAENMTLSCVKCGEKTEATPVPKFHTGGVVPSILTVKHMRPDLPDEHILTVAPHVSLSEAMRAAEDRRSSNLTATMINQAIGMTLVKLGKTEITFSEAEIIDFAAKHRVAMKQNLDFSFTVSVIPRVPE